MYDEMLLFVEEMLIKNNGIKSKNKFHNFRNRFEHTKRVLKWVEKLVPDYPNCNKEVCYIAAIFHDVGYGGPEFKGHHSERGAEIFMDFSKYLDLSKEDINHIYDIIMHHTDKSLIFDPNSSDEMVIVLEADLLDEEGALGIAFDLMSAGAKNGDSYHIGLAEIMMHTAHILNQSPMKSPLAIKYWEEKKEFVRKFIELYSNDMA